MVNRELRLMIALSRCEALLSTGGVPVPAAIEQSAKACNVNAVELALLFTRKTAACAKARLELQQPAPPKDGDA